MPATAGRVRMPANNRVHSSAALQTHGIWQSAIGYDPYAPTNKDSDKGSARPGEDGAAESSENAYASFQGLLALARVTGSGSNEARGACKKCGRVGHLTFQCRNFLSAKDFDKDKDDAALQAAATAAFEQIKKSNGLKVESIEEEDDEEEEEESDSSDSNVDPEIEKIIAARFGKKSKKNTDHKRANDSKGEKVSHRHRGRSRQRSRRKRSDDSDESDSDEVDEKRQKRRRRRRGSDEDVEEDKQEHRRSRKSRRDKKRRKSHRKKDESDDYNDDSEDESDRQRRHHHKRGHHRRNDSGSDSDDGDSDKAKFRKKSRRHHD